MSPTASLASIHGALPEVQLVAYAAAFWLAVARCRGSRPVLAVLAIACCGGTAHAGWLLLHADRLLDPSAPLILDPTRGFCVLFVPLGPLLVSCRLPRAERGEFLGAVATGLPAALAIARLGCFWGGCCVGKPGLWFGFDHPTSLYAAAAWGVADGLLRRLPLRMRFAGFCAVLGAVRWAIEPWRREPPLGAPVLGVEWIALGLIVGGSLAIAVASAGSQARFVPRSPSERPPPGRSSKGLAIARRGEGSTTGC